MSNSQQVFEEFNTRPGGLSQEQRTDLTELFASDPAFLQEYGVDAETLVDELEDDPSIRARQHYLQYDSEGKLVGYVCIRLNDDTSGEDIVSPKVRLGIRELFVHPDSRGNSFASNLLSYALRNARHDILEQLDPITDREHYAQLESFPVLDITTPTARHKLYLRAAADAGWISDPIPFASELAAQYRSLIIFAGGVQINTPQQGEENVGQVGGKTEHFDLDGIDLAMVQRALLSAEVDLVRTIEEKGMIGVKTTDVGMWERTIGTEAVVQLIRDRVPSFVDATSTSLHILAQE